MRRLLIVDDEAIIADGLYEILQYTEGLELDLYKAYSGLEAMELIEKSRFDIVLTDIRMPGMDGLQLAGELRKKWPKCRIIFLTGHHEFEYVYSAIQHEQVNYVLKTEGFDKVIATIRQALKEIEQSFHAEGIILHAKEQQQKTIGLLRQQFFIDLIKERVHYNEVSQALFDELDIELRAEESILLIVGKVHQFPKQLSYSERAQLLYQLEYIANQYFQDYRMNYSVVPFGNELLWFIQPASELGTTTYSNDLDWSELLLLLQGHVDLLQEAFRMTLSIDVSLVIDTGKVLWEHIAERYELLQLLFQYRIGQHSNQIMTNTRMMESNQREVMYKPHLRAVKIEQLNTLLQNGQPKEYFAILQPLTDGFIVSSAPYIAEEVYLSIALMYYSYINRWNIVEDVAEQIRIHRLLQSKEHASWQEAAAYLHNVGKVLFAMQNQLEEERAASVVYKLKQYIREHLHDSDKVSLIHLAEVVFFNPSYLSRFFKQETGTTLSDYITATRIEKAKQLLAQSDLKVQDVAERVGYVNATNFTRFFRKLTGVTPQDYRVKLIH
ncbi:response regulator transcription factor [Paenibacillus sp. FA6]|uniref:response regulator transcription factor n=1 Tax=Paenibacillus sp. FA6 TaxID=3413029 RepID=UPI003F660BE4